MSKGKTAITVGKGIGISLALYLLLQFLWALLLIKSVVPEERAGVLVTVSCGIAAFVGARFAAKKGAGFPSALGSTCGFLALVLLAGYLIFDGMAQQGWILLAVGLVCGCVAGMSKVGKKKRKKRKR
ncbi:TIGR04086 family membrane protein [Oscillibacter sp. MSJ-2]|uniref:TIGR04086 family membrane protein n=1 Tax=Dysosmobacter acutus TaxID=2841504 RepID=A0ABS6FAK8_9FIRM|nr:TIGR04086 family membrane protein [Dysosmobacter acutus]MBU5627207.1 TIGR04086 family membrane protein [Dysosmobacter acutus]